MRLNDEQITQYDQDGYLVFHDLLSTPEIQLLQRSSEHLRTSHRGHAEANVHEKDRESIRAAWAPYLDSKAVAAALRLPRLLGPVRQLLGDDVYLYQSRLNYKVARRGDVFQWHQDYQSWAMDGVPDGGARKMLSVLITLDECEPWNGPLKLVRGSHKNGHISPYYDTETTSYALHTVPDEKVNELLNGEAPVLCDGPEGTVVIFDGCLVHGSDANQSERDRRNLYFAYNRRDNLPVGSPTRKHANAYIMNDDTERLRSVEEDALLELASACGLTESTT